MKPRETMGENMRSSWVSTVQLLLSFRSNGGLPYAATLSHVGRYAGVRPVTIRARDLRHVIANPALRAK